MSKKNNAVSLYPNRKIEQPKPQSGRAAKALKKQKVAGDQHDGTPHQHPPTSGTNR